MKIFIILCAVALLSFKSIATLKSKNNLNFDLKIKFYDVHYTLLYDEKKMRLTSDKYDLMYDVKKCNKNYINRMMRELIGEIDPYGQIKRNGVDIEIIYNDKKFYVSKNIPFGKELMNIRGIFETVQLTGESLCRK